MTRIEKVRKALLYFFIFLLATYFLGGIVTAFAAYKFHSEKKIVFWAAKIYPLPAAVVSYTNTVWLGKYYTQLQYVRHFSQKTKQELPPTEQLRAQIMDDLITNEILAKQEAKYKIKVSKKDVDDAFAKIAEKQGGEKEMQKVLNDLYGMKIFDFKKLIAIQVAREKLMEKFVQIHARHILIKDEAKAREILDRVKKGEDFVELAKQFSEDTGSRDNGGDLGFFGRGQMVKEFEKTAFNTEVGKIADDLTKTEFGFHIIKVEERKGAIDQSFADWLTDLKKKTKILRMIK